MRSLLPRRLAIVVVAFAVSLGQADPLAAQSRPLYPEDNLDACRLVIDEEEPSVDTQNRQLIDTSKPAIN